MILSWLLIFQLAVPVGPAYAVTDNQTNALSVDAGALKPAGVNCDNFCGNLVAEAAEEFQDTKQFKQEEIDKRTMNTSGSGGWSQKDDEWCAKHGSPSDPSLPKQEVKDSDYVDKTQCNVPMLKTDDSCKNVNKKLLRCKYRNSMVIPQCLAYQAAAQANEWQYPLMILDFAAAATCAGACIWTWAGDAGNIACGAATFVTSGMEMTAQCYMSSSGIQKAITGVAGTAGAVSALIPLINATSSAQGAGLTTKTVETGGKGTSQTAAKVASCASMVLMAIIGGIRVANIIQTDGAKEDACEALQKMASEAQVMDPFGQPDVNFNNYAPKNGSGGGTQVAGTGGSTSNPGGLGGGASKDANCVSQNGLISCPVAGVPPGTTVASTDGGFLSKTGLDKVAAPMAKQMIDAGVGRRKPDAAGIMGAALGEGANTAEGQGLKDLAKAAQDDANKLGGIFGSSVYSGGGGGRSSASAAAAAGPMFGFKAAGPAAHSDLEFEKRKKGDNILSPDGDIWHEGYRGTIFQIVSGKLEVTRGRVDQMEWQTPLNRALNGLKNTGGKK